MTVITVPVLKSAYDASTTVGVAFNAEWFGGNLHHGTHKSGNPNSPFLRFDGLNIPPGSTINSASIELEAVNVTGVGSMNAFIDMLVNDGAWDVDNVPDQWTASASVNDWHAELLDVVTQLVITGAAAQARAFGPTLKGDNGDLLKRVGQGVEITVAGDITIARVSLGGPFTPLAGNVWVEIYSDDGGIPGTLLGTSATRPASDIVPKLFAQVRPTYDFTFSGGEVVTVAVNDLIHVVMREDQPVGQVGVHLGTSNYAYPGGDLTPFGESPDGGYDQQNYLTTDDLDGISTVGTSVAWSVTLVLGVQVSVDIASLIQSHIDAAGYLYTAPAGLRLTRGAGAGQIIWGSVTNVATQDPELTVDFTALALLTIPDVVGLAQAAAELAIIAAGFTVGTVTFANSDTVPAGDVISQDPVGGTMAAPFTLVDIVVSLGPAADDKLADPGKPRGWEPFDLGYYRTKYGRKRSVPAVEAISDVVVLSDYLEALANEQRDEDVQRTRLRIREQNTETTELLDRLEAERLELESRLEALAAKHDEMLEAIRMAKLELKRRRNEEAAAIAVAMFYFY